MVKVVALRDSPESPKRTFSSVDFPTPFGPTSDSISEPNCTCSLGV